MRFSRFLLALSLLPSSIKRSSRLGLFALLVVTLPAYSPAQQTATIRQMPRDVRNGTAQLVGHYDSNQMLRLVFALKPPHMEEEEQLLRELQNKNSPLFHRFLSDKEWNERFAPSPEDELAVAGWAQSQGLTITQRYPNRLLVDVEAPAGVIEKALGVTINRYQLGSASYFSNDRDPAVPAQVAGAVQAVLGLNNLEVMHSASHNIKELPHPDYSPGPAYTVGSRLQGDATPKKSQAVSASQKSGVKPKSLYGWYNPSDIYADYGYDYKGLQNLGHCCNPLNNPNNSPPESSIAIAIWDDFLDSDFYAFATASQPVMAYNVQRYFVDGFPTCCGMEPTLDVEWSTAMSNSFLSIATTAQVHVYEGTNGQNSTVLDVLNRILTDGHARVLSMSWGAAEIYMSDGHTMDSYHAVFNQMVGQGWTLVAASGDGGATDDCADHLSVDFPPSDPDVTAAGGTALVENSYGWFQSEVAWSGGPYGCANNDGGGGGGCSAYYAAPDYQANQACGAGSRSVPDLALNADAFYTPQLFVYQSNYLPTGGTSIVAPEIAGFYAQENAYLLYLQSIVGNTCGSSMSAPCAPMGNANYYLYEEGLYRRAPHYPFYDITSGCNGNDITQKYGLTPWCAGPGYDFVTGFGSANMLQLAWAINDNLAGDSGGPSISVSGPQLNHWYNSDQTINWTVTDSTGNGHPATGVAGFAAVWDADPGDPYSEPTPNPNYPWLHVWNSFYSGPETPNATVGSEYFSSMPLQQGCHILHVRAWDNSGVASPDSTYGPVCYDPYPPNTYASLSGNQQGQYYAGPVQVTFEAFDYNSGVASTMYQINSGPWLTYSGPFNVTAPGIYIVSFYSTDNAGNVETTQYADFIIAYNWQYQLSVSKSGSGSGTVTSADGIINCGSTCSSSYYNGSQITLTATPAPGSVFTGWSGCDLSFGFTCSLTLTSDRNPTAIFNPPVALQFVPMTPCRLVDTRTVDGGTGPIQAGTSQSFNLPQLAQALHCGDLSSAAAYSLNATVIPNSALGYMTLWPSGLTRPLTSTLNSVDGRIKANAAIVPAGTAGAVTVYVTDTTDVVLDIDGYFVPAPSPSALAFYPLTPCRVADTRSTMFPTGLGMPELAGGMERDFPVLSSTCPIPPSAQAYSLNFTAIPPNLGEPLGFLEVWPTGQQPLNPVSTLNNLTGTIVANAAIVPAGSGGQIAVYPSSNTDLVIDINGYFAAPGPNGMSLYSAAPCRVIDTRTTGTRQPFNGTLSPPIGVASSPCAPPSTAQAYVFNATVVPDGELGFLTLWPDGQTRPVVSTLNAIDGAITNNMAIVPTSNGSIDAYANGLTQLVLDISSYFAP